MRQEIRKLACSYFIKQSRRFCEDGILNFEGCPRFVTVIHHAETVSGPQGNEINSSIPSNPLCVVCHVIISVHIHVLNHPLKASSVVVIPSAIASSLFWPQVDHLAGVVCWVGKCASSSKWPAHVQQFDIVIWEVMVNEQIEEFVLCPSVKSTVDGPEEELICCKWESASEKIGRSLFKWNSEQSLSWWCIVSPKFDWPRLIGVVGPSCIFERNYEPACWQVSNVRCN